MVNATLTARHAAGRRRRRPARVVFEGVKHDAWRMRLADGRALSARLAARGEVAYGILD